MFCLFFVTLLSGFNSGCGQQTELYPFLLLLPPSPSAADDLQKYAIPAANNRGLCLLCKKTFKSLMYTRKHVKIAHTRTDPIECSVCFKVIANIWAFRSHMNLKHGCQGVKNVVETYGRKITDGGEAVAAAAGQEMDVEDVYYDDE